MVGVRALVFIIYQIVDASRIQPSAYLNRQQLENQNAAHKHFSTELGKRHGAQHAHRKSILSLASSSRRDTLGDAAKQSSASNLLQHESNGVQAHIAKNVIRNVTTDHADAVDSSDVHERTYSISSFFEQKVKMIQHNQELPKKCLFLAIILGTIFLVVCFCGVLGSSLSEGSSSNGRHQYLHKGRTLYEWEQTSTVLTLYTKPPDGISKTSLEVSVYPRHLKIGRRGKPPFLKEELYGLADSGRSTWDITEQGELRICLHKGEEGTEWPCVMLAHHPDKKQRQKSSTEPQLN